MSRKDRAIGIALGLVIALIALIVFIFAGSEGSIDAPSLHQSTAAEQPAADQK